ncbi:hypothetical protein ACMD2_04623 [Ananas comosus]|uniref:Uncharacterized protein n=1 Tax=Ananas comosus TaxID=4615 RepID=A0A199W481_ANACO|nr:hypothetical protein ACMD2_04623 [Ananas comosus]
MGVFQMDEKPGFLTEVAKKDMPYNLSWAFTPRLECPWIGRELKDEAILSINLLLSNAAGVREHARCSSFEQHSYSPTKRSGRALGCMGPEPWSMPPYNPAVASGVHLRAPDSKLDIPHFRGHLPQNKSAGFSGLGCISVLDDFGAGLKFGGHHFQFTHGISISNGAQKLKTAGCSYVLLQYLTIKDTGFRNGSTCMHDHN